MGWWRRGIRRTQMGLASVAAAVVLAPLLLWTGGGSAAAAGSGDINPKGVLTYGVTLNNEFSNTFDPALVDNGCSFAELSLIYSSITSPGNTAVTGAIAQSWQVSNDDKTITLHLRPGAVFSNGQPVTAADIIASINHIRTNPQRTSLTAVQSMTAVNTETVQIQLNRATAGDFLWASSFLDGMVLDASTISTDATAPVGSGPYKLKSYQQGSSLVLVKNPKAWDASAYKLGGIDFVEVAPGPQSVSALMSGSVDMIPLEPENYPEVKNDPQIGIASTKSYDYMVIQLRENRAPFNNPKLRAALEYAVNRAQINKVVFDGQGLPAYQPFPSWSVGFNKSVGDRYQYDPKKVKSMLAAAGYPHGVSFTLEVPSGDATFQRAATIMQSEIDGAGFRMNLQFVPGADILTDVYIDKDGAALLSDELSNGPDLSNNFESEYEPGGFGAEELGTVNMGVTPLIEKANTSLSPSVQGPLMQQAGKYVMSQGLEVPIEFMPSLIAYNKDRVGGKVTAPIGECRSDLQGIYIKK